MHLMPKRSLALFASLALGTGSMLAVPAAAQVAPHPVVTAKLAGGNDTAAFTGVVKEEEGTLCYILNSTQVEPASGAMIRDGAGNVVAQLEQPEGGASGDCAAIGTDLAAAMVADPSAYEVVVTSESAIAGEVSGRLM